MNQINENIIFTADDYKDFTKKTLAEYAVAIDKCEKLFWEYLRKGRLKEASSIWKTKKKIEFYCDKKRIDGSKNGYDYKNRK